VSSSNCAIVEHRPECGLRRSLHDCASLRVLPSRFCHLIRRHRGAMGHEGGGSDKAVVGHYSIVLHDGDGFASRFCLLTPKSS